MRTMLQRHEAGWDTPKGEGTAFWGLTFQWLEGLDWTYESPELPMNISEAARQSGLSSKTIRYYEEIGLVAPARRGDNGYRQYEQRAVEEFQFLARARDVGFDLDECRQLLELHRDSGRQSRHARELVLEKSNQLQQRIERLLAMREVLQDMASRCHGDEGPECAILDDLARGEGNAA